MPQDYVPANFFQVCAFENSPSSDLASDDYVRQARPVIPLLFRGNSWIFIPIQRRAPALQHARSLQISTRQTNPDLRIYGLPNGTLSLSLPLLTARTILCHPPADDVGHQPQRYYHRQ